MKESKSKKQRGSSNKKETVEQIDENSSKLNIQPISLKQYNPSSNVDHLIQKNEPQIQSLMESSKLGRGDSKVVDKKQIQKKPRIIIDNFTQYLPQFLILINQQKHKNIIRIGKNYQADVPTRCSFTYRYRPLSHLKLWSPGEFQVGILKKFRQKFGETRTQQDLCLLMYQYQCDWSEINTYINEYKGELRKNYLQKDRTKT